MVAAQQRGRQQPPAYRTVEVGSPRWTPASGVATAAAQPMMSRLTMWAREALCLASAEVTVAESQWSARGLPLEMLRQPLWGTWSMEQVEAV